MNIRSIADIGDCKDKRVIVRVDFNVPIQDGKVVDDLRIKKSLRTMEFLKDKGAKMILISHIEGKGGENLSLSPVAGHLQKIFPVSFAGSVFGADTERLLADMKGGDAVLLENLRNEEGEKKNDAAFAGKLAAYADAYVNDAFSVSHRTHASVVALPALLPHFAGFGLLEEIDHLSAVFHPPRPFFFIIGGAKFDGKMPLIRKFLDLADHLFVGGALANNFFKEEGLNVGRSLVSEGDFGLKEYFADERLVLPVDIVVRNAAAGVSVKKTGDIGADDTVMDIGPASLAEIKEIVQRSKFVLWNGPVGNYEEGFKDQTIGIAQAIADSGVEAALGGGDTTAALSTVDLEDDSKIFVSTGGGAMLQYLLDETLPGIDALK